MDHTYTSNEFLFSFKGRINRAKYWYAAFASGISCLFFLFVLALVLGGMFGVASKSVYVSIDIFEIFNNPPSFPLRASFGRLIIISLRLQPGVRRREKIPTAPAVSR